MGKGCSQIYIFFKQPNKKYVFMHNKSHPLHYRLDHVKNLLHLVPVFINDVLEGIFWSISLTMREIFT